MVPERRSMALFVTDTLAMMQRTGDWDQLAAELDAVTAALSRLDDAAFGHCLACGSELSEVSFAEGDDSPCCLACSSTRR